MTEQLDLYDLPEGRRRRDEGMAKVLGPEERWLQGYEALTEIWFKGLLIGSTFIGEDIRRFIGKAIGEPHHVNVWSASAGSVIRRHLKLGRIVVDGMAQAHGKKAHARICKRYRRVA